VSRLATVLDLVFGMRHLRAATLIEDDGFALHLCKDSAA
jgi:hypothetical protein